jgi:hypothetical protein
MGSGCSEPTRPRATGTPGSLSGADALRAEKRPAHSVASHRTPLGGSPSRAALRSPAPYSQLIGGRRVLDGPLYDATAYAGAVIRG